MHIKSDLAFLVILKFIKSSYSKLKGILTKTGSLLGSKIRSLFGSEEISEDKLEQLEQIFYEADLGVEMSSLLTKRVRELYKKNPKLDSNEIIAALSEEVVLMLNKTPETAKVPYPETGPLVILIIGVNGNGKTTSVAKLAKMFQEQGNKVLLAATDTFRAAGIEQLEIWAKRLNTELVKGAPNSDPAAVAFDALTAAKARNVDVVIIDTAGRLHTRGDLMKELEKIRKACQKVIPGSPHETLLILDATTGQNAIDQATVFHKYTPITGLVLTKLDGTAKGGIILNIQNKLGIKVQYIGVGEGPDDLETFQPESFVKALLE